MELQPVKRTSVPDAVFDQLAAQIVGGALDAGEALPAERALTESLGVNRQAVREALKRLAQAGLVEVRQGDATRVADFRRDAGLDLLPRLLVGPSGAVEPAVVRSIMEMRACIGPDLARLCAQRATPRHQERIEAAVALMATIDPDDLPALGAADLAFWDALVEGADNIAYRLALNSLRRVTEAAGPLLHEVLADELRDTAERRAIAAAVSRSQPEVAEAAARSLLTKGSAAVAALLVAVASDQPGVAGPDPGALR